MKIAGIDSIETNTGRTLTAWYTTLDEAGGDYHTLRELQQVLVSHFGVGPFWAMCIANCYAKERGIPGYQLVR